MFLILGKPIIHDGRSFSHTVPVALKSDQVTSAKIKHGMVVNQLTGCMEILLWTEPNSTGCKAYLYTVDEKVALVIEEWKQKIANLTTEYNIVFKDHSGEEISAFSWMFQPDDHKENNCILNNVSSVDGGLRMEDGSNRRLLVINHLVRGWAKRYVEWKAFEFHSDDVAKISAVSIELAE